MREKVGFIEKKVLCLRFCFFVCRPNNGMKWCRTSTAGCSETTRSTRMSLLTSAMRFCRLSKGDAGKKSILQYISKVCVHTSAYPTTC